MSLGAEYYEKQIALWAVRGRHRIKSKKVVSAIERAADNIGSDIVMPELRRKLKDAVLLNCDDRKAYPFRYLGVDFVSERDFYRRKELFLEDVFKGLLKKSHTD